MNKQKRLETLRDLIKSGKAKTREIGKLFVTDTDGTNIPLNSPEALDAIERRLAEMEDAG
jgi:hypothetical protein